jgi:xanthine dehydrogenase accessory factor
MLVLPDGTIQGTIGGGCGEAEVWQVACDLLELQQTGSTQIVHVDLTDDFASDQGKVCGGRFDVLVEIWDSSDLTDQSLSSQIDQAFQEDREFVLLRYLGPETAPSWKKSSSQPDLTAVPLGRKKRVLIDTFDCALDASESDLQLRASQQLSQQDAAYFVEHIQEGSHAFFADRHNLRQQLVIAGAGHIARPLCTMATMVGYQVTIIDDRPEYAVASSFPEAKQVICAPFVDFFRKLECDQRTSVVLVTRGHKHDQDSLWELREKPAAYIGMIGSQRRVKAVFEEFQGRCDPNWLSSIKAPIGLDIGAQTPAEIAICILAEMIGHKRKGPKLRVPSLSRD